MAGLTIGKRDVAKIADVLEQDYDSAEDAARAALEACFALYESKAKFTVVGQLAYSPEGGWQGREDAHQCMVALGMYGTETPAKNDALAFAISTATHEQFKAWVLPVYHGTPASYFTKRKDAKKAKAKSAEVVDAVERFKQDPSKTPEQAAAELRMRFGWQVDEELAALKVERNACPECGQEIETEHDPLQGGYEVSA